MSDRELSGREMDRAVAERVMGWRNVSVAYISVGLGGDDPLQPTKGIQEVPRYHESIEAAIRVVEKIRVNYDVSIHTGSHGNWAVVLKTGDPIPVAAVSGPSLPDCICRAALATTDTVGIRIPEPALLNETSN